jgi:hypothetical protein
MNCAAFRDLPARVQVAISSLFYLAASFDVLVKKGTAQGTKL